jgi:two-component system OmpR family response regulator
MPDNARILIVDDDADIRNLVARYLRKRGFLVAGERGAEGARRHLADNRVDLLVLDLMLPGENGLNFCRSLRANGSKVPVIMLTALGEEADRVVGLESGADDYLIKPFSARELVARIEAVLRRTGQSPQEVKDERLEFAGFVLEATSRVLKDSGEREINLTSLEYELLLALARRPRRVLSRDQLLDLTRGRSAKTFDRSIDVQISRLRRKLKRNPDDPEIIKTVRFGGYVFAVEVTPC